MFLVIIYVVFNHGYRNFILN